MNWEGDDPIPTIGLVVNTQKDKAIEVVYKVIDLLEEMRGDYLIEKEAAAIIGKEDRKADFNTLRGKADIIITLGGDGTFLHTAHHFIGTGIPLLGINIGKLGFLTELEISEIERAFNFLFQGNYEVERRMLLQAKVIREGREVYKSHALNDIVVNRGANSRMVNLKVFINNEIVNSYRADGIILATPTGSTAYSLSAGGPIVNPMIRAILITPICPHTLYIRPMVISDRENIKLITSSEDRMKITTDGRDDYDLFSGDQIMVTASDEEIPIIKLPDRNFYNILYEKMRD